MALAADFEGAIPLSLPRRWINDLTHFAKAIPSIPVQREIDLSPLIAVRSQCERKYSWPAIFLKAYGLVCKDMPELRRCYLSKPYARLWQHGYSTASIAIHREFRGEDAVFFVKIRKPENRPVFKLEEILRNHREKPVEKIGSFRRLIRITGYPSFARRLLWDAGLNWNGEIRRKFLGTFGLSVYSATGCDSLHPLSPYTTLLNYGPIRASGLVSLRLIYDHRVMDGLQVAKALKQLESRLLNDLVEELAQEVASNQRLPSTTSSAAA